MSGEDDSVLKSTVEGDIIVHNQVVEADESEGHFPKENGFINGDSLPEECSTDQLLQMIVELKSENEYLKCHFKGLHSQLELAGAHQISRELEQGEPVSENNTQELQDRIESLNRELLEEKQTRFAAEEALKHLRTVHLEADARAQELSVKLAEVQQKMEQEIKERDDKLSDVDSKLNRLHKRAKQRIQDVQKEKDDLESQLLDANERAQQTSSQLSALQQDLERTRQQANEALKAMDGERKQLRTANNKLRDNIEELRHSLLPKEHALDTLQQSLSEKDQMLEDLRGLLRDADEKKQTSIVEISAKHQKNLESLESQLADAISDRHKATETISALRARLAERESEIAELDAALSGEAARSKASVETVKGELAHLKDEHEKEKQSWEATCHSLKKKLEVAESNCIRVEIEAAKTRSQMELELSKQMQLLNSRDTELAIVKEENKRLEAEFSSYKVRAHSLLQKKDADLAAAKDSEQFKALEDALKDAEQDIFLLSTERDQARKELQDALANHERELLEKDTNLVILEKKLKDLEMKLESDRIKHQSEKEVWELNIENLEETWQLKFKALKAENEAVARPDLEKDMEELKMKYKKLKEEHNSFRDLADRMIEEKDKEISRLVYDNKNLHRSIEARYLVEDDNKQKTVSSAFEKQDPSASAAEQQILILARQQAQREEELAHSQRHILALQEEIEELERENRLHTQQVNMLKEELRSMDRTQKREGVDLTYLKNVIMKLLETGEVEALLPVVATLLQFSPDEVIKCQQAYHSNTPDVPQNPPASDGPSRSLFSRFTFG
ncbi:hypothetical protein V2J09_021630 [Rumex salicifolius]